MAVKIEEFVAYLGWEVDSSELKKFKDQAKDAAGFVAKIGAAIAGATAALSAFTVVTNKQTAEMANLADSVGISVDALVALDSVAQGLGKDTETIVDLVEEMNNKFGEMKGLGELTSLQEGVKLLGLEYKNLKDLKPEEQFTTILDAAKNLEDQQRAVSGVDMIFGGEANKILGSIRQIDGSLADLIERRKQLNFLSEDGAEKAKEFNALWVNAGTVAKTASAEFAALLGDSLSPLLKEFLEWVRANRELIKLKIAEWAEKVGRFLKTVFRVLKQGLLVLDKVIDAFGGLENVLAAIAGIVTGLALVKLVKVFQILIPLIWSAVKAQGAWNLVMKGGKLAGFIGLIVLAALAINSLVRFFQGKDSLVGDIGGVLGEKLHEWMGDLGEFLGFSREEFDLWVVGLVDDISDGFASAWEAVSGFFEKLSALTWDDIFDAWKEVWTTFVWWLEGLWNDFVNWLTDTVPNKILSAFRDVLSKAASLVKQIPLIGDLIAGDEGIKGAVARTGQLAPPIQQPSPGVTQAITQNRTIQRSISNQRGGDRTLNMPVTVHQQPGENGEALARRIQRGVREEFASAIRDNDTGVAY